MGADGLVRIDWSQGSMGEDVRLALRQNGLR